MFVWFSRFAKKYWILGGSLAIILAAVGGLVWHGGMSREIAGVVGSVASSTSSSAGTVLARQKELKPLAERMREAEARAANIKGLYMTADVANDQGRGAVGLRNNIIALAEKTEINAIVIDVKEVCGPDYNEKHLSSLLAELHQKNIWAIARIVAFKDASQMNAHPEWYLKRATSKVIPDVGCARKKYLRAPAPAGSALSAPLWQDNKGGYWMDPASSGARQYIVDVAKKMADLGFDEVQFDYIRFPSDGDVARAVYPAWDGKTPKYVVMKSFFEFLRNNLKAYRPELILSADVFGYVATSGGDVGIGQRLEDIGDSFDFISLMVYPSHYYHGFILPADPVRKLPTIHWNVNETRANPGVLIERVMFFAEDLLNKRTASSSLSAVASSTVLAAGASTTPRHAQLRPWLEDFFHEADRIAGRPSGELKVQLQTNAAEKSSQHGWLLWNASNIYIESALKAE